MKDKAKNKILTIAIPCYNSAAYMRKCIESCLLGGDDVEIIIVDDGSTKDDTLLIAKEYENLHPNIVRVIHQENGGHGAAVNTGMRNATGKYFKVVDSDDWLDAPAYKEVLKSLKSFNKVFPDLFFVNFVYENQRKYHKKRIHFTNVFPQNKIFSWQDIGKFRLDQYILMHNVIYKTEVLQKCRLRLPEHMFYVDNIFVYTPLPFVHKLYYLNVNLYRYFIGREDQSVNEKVMIGRIDQQIYLNKKMTKTFLNARIKEPKCRKYMLKYLTIMYAVSTMLLLVSGTREHLDKKKELWKFLKETDPTLYKKIRYGLVGFIINTPGGISRKLLVKAYHGLGKYIGFN